MPSYEVFLQPRAERSLSRLPADVQRRVKSSILALAGDPRPPGARKLAGQRETWRVRVGDWRIIYLPDDARRSVLVTVIGHRRDVYRS